MKRQLLTAAILVLTSLASATVNPVGHWPFDTNPNDIAGGNDGVLVNGAAITNTPGEYHIGTGAVTFDGINDYVDINPSAVNTLDEGTVSVWIYPEQADDYNMIFSLSDSQGSDTARMGYVRRPIDDSLSIFWFVLISGEVQVAAFTLGDDVPLNAWSHIALTVDSNGNAIYVDGQKRSLDYITGDSSSSVFFNDPDHDHFHIGNRDTEGTTWDNYFLGQIDDVRVYDRALSAEEILAISDGLVAHWTFDSDATDIAGGNDGTFENGAAITNTPGEYRIGTGAATFDGIDDRVSTAYAGISGNAARTTCAWFKCNGTTGLYQSIFSYGGGANGTRWAIYIHQDDGRIINAIWTGRACGDTTSLWDGQWHHVAVTFPPGGTHTQDIKIYVDGYEDATWYINGATQTINTSTLYAFEIGHGNGGANRPFNGQIDDVRVYDRELSGDEILALVSEATITVAVDIKPGGCPNPLRVNFIGSGVFPVAIVGSEDFDATTIDPDTVTLIGVAPLRAKVSDVSTAGDVCELGPDGIPDLTLKFDRQAVLAALEDLYGTLGDLPNREELFLTLLAETNEGEPVTGTDSLVILNRGAIKRKK